MATPKEQLLSRTVFDTDGVTTVWDFAFSGGYLDKSHVRAFTETPAGVRTVVSFDPNDALIGEFQLEIIPALPAGDELVIFRDTPKDLPLVDFSDESGFSEISLDTNAKQAVFIAAEAIDTVNSLDVNTAINAAESAGTSAQEAAADAAIATAQAAIATAQAVSATNSAAAADADRLATLAALNDALAIYGSIAAVQAADSSASASATAAASSATAAAGSASAAATSATNASNSATEAAGSATTATTQAGNAATSASAATASASSALTSANNAATSATSASNSATVAGTWAAEALDSRNDAQAAQAAAEAAAFGIPRVTSGSITRANVNGKVFVTDAGQTVPSGEFQAGDVFAIANESDASITITQGVSLTLYNAATAATGNVTVTARGMAVVRFASATIAYISGAGVS